MIMNINKIKQELQIEVHHFPEVTSTNDIAARSIYEDNVLIIANRQTNGRGTNGRSFMSPDGGLYFSYVTKNNIENITFKVASSILQAINKAGVQVKWINDLYFDNKKFCGILVEKVDDKYIIGVGINITNVDEKFSSLHEIDKNIEVEEVLIKTIFNINKNFNYMQMYRRNCLTIDKEVVYKNEKYKVIDINDNGSLKIKNNNKTVNITNRNDIQFTYVS